MHLKRYRGGKSREIRIVMTYKELWQIGRIFKTIKSFLKIAQPYHKKPERICAQEFVSVLLLLLSRLIERKNRFTIIKRIHILSYVTATLGRVELHLP